MKRHLFFLGNVRQALPGRASYSTVSACVVSFVFLFMAINCGPPPQGQYHVPESAIAAAEKTTRPASMQNGDASLPKSATIQLQKMAYVRNAFKEHHALRAGADLLTFTQGRVGQCSTVLSSTTVRLMF